MSRHDAGQTLVALLIFMMLAITLTLSTTTVIIIALQGDIATQNGDQALQYAQVGLENSLLRLERDNTYSGETLTLTSGTATITVSGTTTKTIVSVGASNTAVRTVTATATISGGVVTLSNWAETP